MSEFLPWKIEHLALRKPLPSLNAEAGCGGLFVVFWCDDFPVGQLMIPGPLLPITPAQLATLAAPRVAKAVGDRIFAGNFRDSPPDHSQAHTINHAAGLAQLLELKDPLETFSRGMRPSSSVDSDSAASTVSVVICTRDRPEALKKCLASLRSLAPRPDEILVVDNDPSSGVTPAVTALFPEVRCVSESRPGLSAARNTGIRSTSGKIIAFTDDDVTVHPRWIGAIRKVLDNPDIIASTGLVLPAELMTRAQFAFQGNGLGWDMGYQPIDFDRNFFRNTLREGVPVWRIGAGANMAFRREVFSRIGFFDERLGAGAAGCSEDSELWYRILAEGHRCRYDPEAVVFHTHRSDANGLSEQAFSYMRGHVSALLFQFDRYKHWGNIYRAFVVLPGHFMTLFYRSLKLSVARTLVDPEKESFEPPLGPQIRGFFAGFAHYFRHRHLRTDPIVPRTSRPA